MSAFRRLPLSVCRWRGFQFLDSAAGMRPMATAFSASAAPPQPMSAITQNQIHESVFAARSICNEFRFMVGSLPAPEFEKATSILDLFQAHKTTNPEIVNTSIDLYKRVAEETALKGERRQWLLKPRYFNPILNNWKQCARSGYKTHSYKYVLETFLTLKEKLPDLQLDTCFFGIVLDVLMHQEGRTKSARLAEEFVKTYVPSPNKHIYGQLVSAWSVSNLPEAAIRLEELIGEMKPPSYATYDVLLHYWARRGAVQKVESILSSMQPLTPRWTSLGHLVQCYARTGDIAKAVDLIYKIINKPTKRYKDNIKALGRCAQVVLKFINHKVSRLDNNDPKCSELVTMAETLVERLKESKLLDDDWHEKELGTLMHIYAMAGTEAQVLHVFSQFKKPAAYTYGILIMFYGKNNRAGLAMQWLNKALENPHVEPTVSLFNSAIVAWSHSSLPDAVEQATEVISMMENHPVCRQLGIEPDAVTFCSLLKLYIASKRDDAGERAQVLLEEMDRRNLNIDASAIFLATRACMVARDLARAESCLGRLSPPNEQISRNCLDAWPGISTREAAVEIEDLLEELDSAAPDVASAPGVVLYNIAIRAWIMTEDPDSRDKVWRIYEKMHARAIVPDIVTYGHLIPFFSAGHFEDVKKAITILHSMGQPEPRHFGAVIKGCLEVGDVDTAIDLLINRVDAFFDNPNEYPKVSAGEYERVLNALADKNESFRASELVEIIDTMHERHNIPVDPIVQRSLDQHRTLK